MTTNYQEEYLVPCIKVEKAGKQYFIELPQSELEVLRVLARVEEGTIVPRIADLLRETEKINHSHATIYSLARRLEKKNLVTSEEVDIPVLNSSVKRVVWKKNFDRMEILSVLQELPNQ